MKACVRCSVEKPLDQFHTRPNAAGERVPRGTCKACQVIEAREARAAHPERHREYQRTSRFKTTRRQRQLREKYDMTQAEWDLILDEQDGVCAICLGPAQLGRGGEPVFHGDHNHRTGKFRGILCGLCNRMLGQAMDDPERLRAGARYLEERGF